jgi:hypothetical protein
MKIDSNRKVRDMLPRFQLPAKGGDGERSCFGFPAKYLLFRSREALRDLLHDLALQKLFMYKDHERINNSPLKMSEEVPFQYSCMFIYSTSLLLGLAIVSFRTWCIFKMQAAPYYREVWVHHLDFWHQSLPTLEQPYCCH